MRTVAFSEPSDLERATRASVEVVTNGGVVLLPTETFYGLAGDPFSTEAVSRIFELKDRPPGMPLPVLAGSWSQVEAIAVIPEQHRSWLEGQWPGPVTVVLEARMEIEASGGKTVALRIPGHVLLRRLLCRTGPLTGTSANRHGADSQTTLWAALASIAGEPDLALDGGTTPGGQPTIIVDVTGEQPKTLRGIS